MGKRSHSSSRWLARQDKDPYVQSALQHGFRSRAYFKLQQLDEKFRLFKNGQTVLDLGAAPGGWSQYVISRVGNRGVVYAMDLLDMEPLLGVDFLQGDFLGAAIQQQLADKLCGKKANVILSDIAPNLSGIREYDEARMLELADTVVAFAQQWLDAQGRLVIKLFQGANLQSWVKQITPHFISVTRAKPKASRAESAEFYLVATGLATRPINSDTLLS
jgi:23S rRNA (uridine2552-2'-O)-methyltransferase